MAEHESDQYFATPEQMRRYKAAKILRQVFLYAFLSLLAIFHPDSVYLHDRHLVP
jgi:hypothetical protein